MVGDQVSHMVAKADIFQQVIQFVESGMLQGTVDILFSDFLQFDSKRCQDFAE
jgi:hypothetical protein